MAAAAPHIRPASVGRLPCDIDCGYNHLDQNVPRADGFRDRGRSGRKDLIRRRDHLGDRLPNS
ncbi:MAG: hypothetical protein EA424_25335 [Planctomycetaceae bacterium]|nr:MAG: hypothetical protein EA424_25335 [Planctomycetaceae bacterium]